MAGVPRQGQGYLLGQVTVDPPVEWVRRRPTSDQRAPAQPGPTPQSWMEALIARDRLSGFAGDYEALRAAPPAPLIDSGMQAPLEWWRPDFQQGSTLPNWSMFELLNDPTITPAQKQQIMTYYGLLES